MITQKKKKLYGKKHSARATDNGICILDLVGFKVQLEMSRNDLAVGENEKFGTVFHRNRVAFEVWADSMEGPFLMET